MSAKSLLRKKEIREFLFENLLIYKFFTFENYQEDNDKQASQQLKDYIKSDGKIKPKFIKKKNKLSFKNKKKKAWMRGGDINEEDDIFCLFT